METDYRDYIVSTPDVTTFLRRCSYDEARSAIHEGLVTGESIMHSLSIQPLCPERADDLYRAGEHNGEAAVVVSIPSRLWSEVHSKSSGMEVRDSRIGNRRGFWKISYSVKPEHVIGWIDGKSHRMNLNPKYSGVNDGKRISN